jgi:hypothetical protein
MRTMRRAAPGCSTPVPIRTASSSPQTSAETAQARPVFSPGSRRPTSAIADPRRPRPGDSRLIASSRLVFPAPFGPHRQTLAPSGDSSARS